MKTISLFLLISMVVMLTGCPKKLYSTRPSTELEKNKLVNQINDFLKDRQMAYYCSINNVQVYYNYASGKYSCGSPFSPSPTSSPTSTPIAIGIPTDENRELARRIRNEVIEKGVGAVDGVYNSFIDDLNTGRATTNFIADVIDLGVGATVGIAKGERALQILGVALTAFRGGRKSVDLNFYREQTVPILVNKMDDNRAKIYSEIIQKRDNNKNKPVTDYPMEEVIKDIVRYFNAGTLIRAFQELSKDTAVTAKANEEKVLQQKIDRPFTKEEIEASKTTFNGIRGIREKLETARGKKDQKQIDEITKTYESIYTLIIFDPILKPVVDDLVGRVFFVSPPTENITGVESECITQVDRDFNAQVKNKEKLKCADDYDTFLGRINFLVTSDLTKYAKENERFQKILTENGVIKKETK